MLSRLSRSAARIGGRTSPRGLVPLYWALVVGLLVSACAAPPTAPTPYGRLRPQPAAARAVAPGVTAVPGVLPFPIEQNVGQADPGVGYLLRAGAMQVDFGAGGPTYMLAVPSAPAGPGSAGRSTNRPAQAVADVPAPGWTVRQELVGASTAMPSGTVGSPTTISYFKGPAEQWQVGVPAFEQVAYTEAWPGITVTYERGVGGPKSAYLVAAGADPGRIRLLYSGARVRVDEGGMLVAATPLGELRESPPVAWQERDGAREAVEARYELMGNPDADETEYGFALGAYDPALPLVIDPQIAYASFIGGSGRDWGRAIAGDGAGNVYVTGMIEAPGTFSGTPSTFDGTHNGDIDAFVAKLNPAGTGLLYASFIGGSGKESGFGIAIDTAGNAYVAGLTESSQATFPISGGLGSLATFDGTYNGGSGIEFGGDAFVAKVNPAGTALVYVGYIGGSGDDVASGIAVDAQGRAYVAGLTFSSEATFPDGDGFGTLATFDSTYNGGVGNAAGDAFVARVKADGTGLEYAGYIGGNGLDQAYGIAVDGAGNAYVTGRVESSDTTFPNGGGMGPLPASFDKSFNGGGSDAFVARLNATGTALTYATYIGGNGYDYAYSIAVDGTGNAYIAGSVQSSEATFPNGAGMGSLTTFDKTFNGGIGDGFVAKLNAGGTALVYAGYIGGDGFDTAIGIAIDGAGNAYITGDTTSTEATFPTGTGMVLPTPLTPTSPPTPKVPTFHGATYINADARYGDGFMAKVNAAGTALDYAGFLGGTGVDSGPPFSTETGVGIAVDPAGNAYVIGRTNSSETTFPDGLSMAGLPTFDGTYGGGLADAFVVKVTPGASCTLVGRQALTGLNTAYLASYYAYIDYLTYGTTNSYNALAFEYQAYLDSQTAQTAYANRNYTTAKRYFGSSATYASWGWQYAYAAYQASGSQYAYAAYVYGYYASAYEAQAYTEAVAGC